MAQKVQKAFIAPNYTCSSQNLAHTCSIISSFNTGITPAFANLRTKLRPVEKFHIASAANFGSKVYLINCLRMNSRFNRAGPPQQSYLAPIAKSGRNPKGFVAS